MESMTDNPTSMPSANELDDATRIFAPGSGAPSTGSPSPQSAPSASSQSSAPTWRSTTSASSSASAPEPAPGWRGAPAASAGAPWAGQQAQPWPAQSWGASQAQPSAQRPWNGQDWDQQQARAGQGGYPPQAPYAAAPQPAAPGHRDGLRALFDLSFTDMVTPLIVKVLYVLSMVVGFLWWLFAVLVGAGVASLGSGYYSRSGGSGVMLVLGILFGWIPGAAGVLATRMICEFVLAGLKTRRAAEDILKRLDESE